jgi:hypothetical protein
MRRGFDAQRKTGGGGRPALMASQQVERTAELQDPEVRAELDWRVCKCVRECSAGAGSARFRRRVRVQGNRPRASRLRANGVRAEWEQRVGGATRRGGPAGGYAGVPAVFLQHTRASREGSAREQDDLEVHGGVSIANQSGSIVSSGVHDVQQFLPLVDRSTDHRHHGSPWGVFLQSSSTHCNPLASFFVTHRTSSPSSTSHRRSYSPWEFTFHPFSSTIKATPRFAMTH